DRTDRTAETEAQLLALARNGDEPDIVRATALETLGRIRSPEQLKSVSDLLADPSALVRASALRAFGGTPARQRLSAAVPLLNDPLKAVRLEAARLLIGVPLASLSADEKRMARKAISEYQASLFARADYPETQMQIAGLAMALRHVDAAESAFREAIAMDPQLPDAWLALARVQSATNDRAKAIETLESASKLLPDSGHVFRELGFLYAARQDSGASVAALEKSLKLLGATPEVLELLVLNYLSLKDIPKARDYAAKLRQRFPDYDASAAVRAVR
ncbi:MAG: HEAT repeat domain-containing protein, partial [Pseudomonadota bacterium]